MLRLPSPHARTFTLCRFRKPDKSPQVFYLSMVRFDADVVVDRVAQSLFAPQISLCGLYADVAE